MKENLLIVKDVVKQYGDYTALTNVNITQHQFFHTL